MCYEHTLFVCAQFHISIKFFSISANSEPAMFEWSHFYFKETKTTGQGLKCWQYAAMIQLHLFSNNLLNWKLHCKSTWTLLAEWQLK